MTVSFSVSAAPPVRVAFGFVNSLASLVLGHAVRLLKIPVGDFSHLICERDFQLERAAVAPSIQPAACCSRHSQRWRRSWSRYWNVVEPTRTAWRAPPHTHKSCVRLFLWADLLKFCPQSNRRPERTTRRSASRVWRCSVKAAAEKKRFTIALTSTSTAALVALVDVLLFVFSLSPSLFFCLYFCMCAFVFACTFACLPALQGCPSSMYLKIPCKVWLRMGGLFNTMLNCKCSFLVYSVY